MLRSGDAGFYQWAAFQFPTSDLLTADNANDEFTFSVSQSAGVEYDALRMEITNTSADPSVTGWYDYAWVTGSNTQVLADDAVGQQVTQVNQVPEPSSAALLMVGIALALLWRKRAHAVPHLILAARGRSGTIGLRLSERLPGIRIPLRQSDSDVPIDLQTVIDQCYENGGYDTIDYRQPPVPPMDPDMSRLGRPSGCGERGAGLRTEQYQHLAQASRASCGE